MTTMTRLLVICALIAVLPLILLGCGGGGGGGSSVVSGGGAPAPVTAIAPSATPATQFATAGTVLTDTSTQEFPIHGVSYASPANPSTQGASHASPANISFGDVSGGRRVNADGSISLTFSTSSGPRSIHFRASDITSRNLEGTTARRDDVGYFEFAAADEPLNGGSLAYARAGAVTFDDASLNRLVASPFYFGFATPIANVPMTGLASYRGGTFGYDLTTFTPTLLGGDVHLQVDFAGNKVTGHISDLQEISSGGTSTPYPHRFILSNVSLSRNAQDVTFSGGAKAVDMTTGAIASIPLDISGRPAIQGKVFGPNGEELAGQWQYNDSAGDRLAYGSFATRTESASHPSGALTSPLTFPGSPAQSFSLNTGRTLGATDFHPGISILFLSNANGTLSPSANGDIVLSYSYATLSNSFSGTITFNRTDFAVSSAHSRLGEIVSATRGGVELWLGDRGALSYSRFGYWADNTHGSIDSVISTFYAGRETQASQLPLTGTATYRGTGIGVIAQGPALTRIGGDVQLQANFASSTISGAFTVQSNSHVMGVPASSLPFTSVRLDSTSISGNAFSGTSAVPLQGSASVGSGNYAGRFYGPTGEEVAGHWYVNGASFNSWGAFGAAR